jgi:hypothetical protein
MKNTLVFLLLITLSVLHRDAYGQFVLDNSPNIDASPHIDSGALCTVAGNTKKYLNEFNKDDYAVHSGSAFSETIPLARIKASLDFICKIHHQDLKDNRQSRLHDPQFLTENFEFFRWYPDKKTANLLARNSKNAVKQRLLNNIPPEQIFLTKYYTKLLTGSPVKTSTYPQALFALPYDEKGLSLEQADNKRPQLTRYQFTRQQVISGVLEQQKLANPLIWISEEALHDVLLQGTGVVDVNGQRRYFNVHRNNGIAYDYTLGKRQQKRYWYFAEVGNIMGYGHSLASKIAILPDVTFAGNVKALGLGKIFLVNYKVADKAVNQIGVLADQGGAFDNNLFQLDLLKGSYRGWNDYYAMNKQLPDYVNAWLLLVK